MNKVYELGINFILFLQSLGSWVIPPMEFFTNLGVEQFYLLVTPILYWCIDTSIGIRTGIMLMLSTSIYNFGKWLLHEPRPYWVTSKVKAYVSESSFGIPSGHAQNSVTMWGFIAYSFKKKWLWVLAIALMVLIGFSRMVLGVHFPQDTLAGWLLGILVLMSFIKLEPKVTYWLKQRSLLQKLTLYFLISMAMIVIGVLILIPMKGWNIPTEWTENISTAFPESETVNPFALSSQVTLAGVFLGLSAGHTILFAGSGFNPKGLGWKRVLRYLVGIVGILIIWYGLDMVFPDGEALVPHIFRYIRYFLVGFWVTYLGPIIFIKLKLAEPLKQAS
jgi:membrane-associated phospholipid phosphatase